MERQYTVIALVFSALCILALLLSINQNRPLGSDNLTSNNTSKETDLKPYVERQYDIVQGGQELRVFEVGRKLYVFEKHCPNDGTPLYYIDGYIECPLCGSRWDVTTGELITGSGPANRSLRAYNVTGV